MKTSDFNEIASSLHLKMSKTHKEPGNLKECSPWMSEFRAEFLRNELEVPGKFPFSVNSELSLPRKLFLSFISCIGYMTPLSGLKPYLALLEIILFTHYLLNPLLSCSPVF